MADLMQGVSEYETGTLDTAAVLVNNVSPMNANQMNGVADAIIQMQHVLGAGPDLVGAMADLATRLNAQMNASGILLPIGCVLLHGGPLPPGFVNAFGQEESRTGVTANLFNVYQTTFGAGNGSTTFNVINMQSRIPVGIGTGTGGGASGTGAPTGGTALGSVLMGAWSGEETHTLSIAELPVITPVVNDPGHRHEERANSTGGGASVRTVDASILGDANADQSTVNLTSTNTTGITISPFGSGNAHNLLTPRMGLRFIIKY